jgi:cGMP-dependent protein kinase
MNNSDAYNPTAKNDVKIFSKSEASKAFLRKSLGNNYLFEELHPDDMTRIVDCMRPTFAKNGETVIKEGEMGDLFYCLETGAADASVEGVGVVFTYAAGGCFGELALIYNSPRAASVVATVDCKLWALDLKTFRSILATTSNTKMVKRCSFLKQCQFLDALNNDQISKVSGALETVEFTDGTCIVQQGAVADAFYIIESGAVKCTQIKTTGTELELLELGPGDYFGEMALMLNDTRHASCYAVGPTRCLMLSRTNFDLLLGPVQDQLAKKMRIRILQSVPILSRLSEHKLTKLAGVMRVQSFTDGSHIIRYGEEGSRFYIINEGIAKATRPMPDGSVEELIRLGAHEYFGERALLTSEPRTANIIAVGSVECLVLERTSFQTLLTDVQDELTSQSKRRENTNTRSNDAAATKAEDQYLGPSTTYLYKDLVIKRTVGTGTFGRVKMVQHAGTSQVCALKCMNKSEIVESHQEKNIMTEKNLLFECANSPFILQLLQTYNHTNQILMLMEFIQGGELWSYIYEKQDALKRNKMGGFEMSAVKFYAGNVILAFQHIHSKGIAYRDLKPENLLLDSNGYLKVIDFGFAKKIPYVRGNETHEKTYTLCGTPEYLAPEIVMSKGYDKSVDYWALGCLVYELFLGRTPFQADYTTKTFQAIVASDKNLTFPQGMTPLHVSIIKKMLSANPAFRLGNLSGGVEDIMSDPFFNDMDWTALTKQEIQAPYIPPIKNATDTSNFDQYDEDDGVTPYDGDQGTFADF